jgi:predicted nucleic acid-binding protein
MILVDTSVWIPHLRGRQTQATAKLEAAAAQEPLLIGDLILLEILQGARDEAHAARIERGLRQYDIVPLLDADLAPRAARNYRTGRYGPQDSRPHHRHVLHPIPPSVVT